MSWAAHDLEPYLFRAKLGGVVSVPLCLLGSYSPDILTKWAVYGLGNEIARHSENYDKSREGVMARLTLTENQPGKWQVSKIEAIATWTQLTPKVRIIELPKAAVDQTLSASARKTYQATLDRIAGYLRLRGADAAGLLVVGASPGKSASPSPG